MSEIRREIQRKRVRYSEMEAKLAIPYGQLRPLMSANHLFFGLIGGLPMFECFKGFFAPLHIKE